METNRVGEFSLGWGESLVWDDWRRRFYFVDCASWVVHWLDDGDDEMHSFATPSMTTGLVPTEEGLLLGILDDGVHVLDVDRGTSRLLTPYPDDLDGRCNDACADLDGNLVTGKLNLGPAEGSAWWYSVADGWRVLDRDIANTNGPGACLIDDEMTLIIGDTSAEYFAYPYDGPTGTVGERRVFGDTSGLDGHPDGSTFDRDGGLWCALVGGGQLARFTAAGLDRTLELPVLNPTDVTFAGPDLDRLYVVSIGAGSDASPGGLDGGLLVIDGLAERGRPEPRFSGA